MKVRRVVTGYDAEGNASILTDADAPVVFTSPSVPGYQIAELCVVDRIPTPLRGVDVSGRAWGLEPPESGMVCRIVTRPPETQGSDLESLLDEVGAGDGRSSRTGSQAARPGQHRTSTIDILIILSGQLWLTVGSRELQLQPGDCVVQAGVPHAWHNRGSEPCVMVGVMVPAETAV
jgi:mannose-6-phosphate isomerase-like protein (cupin superfamily)